MCLISFPHRVFFGSNDFYGYVEEVGDSGWVMCMALDIEIQYTISAVSTK